MKVAELLVIDQGTGKKSSYRLLNVIQSDSTVALELIMRIALDIARAHICQRSSRYKFFYRYSYVQDS